MYEIERKISEVKGDLNRFEIVILLARRARQITEKRVALEQQLERKAIAREKDTIKAIGELIDCLLYTSPSPRDLSTSRMPSSA